MNKTLNTISTSLIFALAIACGSGNESTSDPDICAEGSEGCACYRNDTCDESLTCASGLCVSLDGTGGTVSAGGASTGGASTGGVVTTGGTNTSVGGSVGVAGSSNGGEVTGGVENTGGTGVCVPKTCYTIAIELADGQTYPTPDACGIVDDGCGNLIDCGGCEQGVCGGGVPIQKVGAIFTEGVPNLCDGACATDGTTDSQSRVLWYCTAGMSPESEDLQCYQSGGDFLPGIHLWMCSTTTDM